MRANDSKSYLGYLNKLVDQCNNSIGKKPIHADYSSKGYTENWTKEIFVIDSELKTNPWTYKTKYLNREKNRKLL